MGFAEPVRTDTADPWRAFVVNALSDALERFPARKAESLLRREDPSPSPTS